MKTVRLSLNFNTNIILLDKFKKMQFVLQLIYYAVIKFRLDEKELQGKVFRAATGKLLVIGH